MCFSLLWLAQLLVQLVIIGAVVMIIRLLVPLVLGWWGIAGGVIAQIVNIILWAVVSIAAIWLLYDLLVCLIQLWPSRVRLTR